MRGGDGGGGVAFYGGTPVRPSEGTEVCAARANRDGVGRGVEHVTSPEAAVDGVDDGHPRPLIVYHPLFLVGEAVPFGDEIARAMN